MTPYLQRKPIRIVGPGRPDLEIVIKALSVERRLRYRDGAYEDAVLAALAPVVPLGLQLGQALFESGDLRRMRNEGISAAEVIDRLVARVEAQ